MKINTFLINLTSEDPERLRAFYSQTIGLDKNPDMGEDAFHAGGAVIAIDGHSETKGVAKEPQRVLIDFFVDDLKAEQSRGHVTDRDLSRRGCCRRPQHIRAHGTVQGALHGTVRPDSGGLNGSDRTFYASIIPLESPRN